MAGVVRVSCGLRRLPSSSSRLLHASPAALSIADSSTPTHTGQKFESSDYRNARFVTAERQTNPRWAVNLIKEVPPKGVQARVVACDGGPGALGHPRVYINLDEKGHHSCIYCGLRYFKEDAH